MVALGRCPRPDPEYQRFYYEQITLAKNRICHFPLVNKLIDNFNGYENLNYTEAKNKVFLDCIHRIDWINPDILLYGVKKDPDTKPIKYMYNNSDYPYYVELLEKSLTAFDHQHWNEKQYNSFKKRISNCEYSISNSAFEEITTAFRLGFNVGLNNVVYEPAISNGKNSDVMITLNGKKIFIELSSITESKANQKIQHICEKVAQYLFNKISTSEYFHFLLMLDTTKLIHEGPHIDEKKSLERLFAWIDKLCLNELIGFNGSFHIDDYRLHSGIHEYAEYSLSDYPWHRPDARNLIDKQPIFKKWANKITISDTILCPFTYIGCTNKDQYSSVEIHEDSSFSTNQKLVESKYLSSIESGEQQQKSFFNQIKRKISYKIHENQFQYDCPIVFMLKGHLWSNSFETDNDDFSKIKTMIENELKPYPHISGVLMYYTNYTNGKFIKNPNVTKKIGLSKSEITRLFS